MRSLLGFLLLVLGGYLAWVTVLFFAQRQMIYLRRGLPALPGADRLVPGLRTYRVPVPGGEVDAWFLPPAGGGPAPALLFTHGNAELIDHAVRDFAVFAERGVGVMLVEYPGYGRSTGRPSQATIVAAVSGAYDTLVTQPEVDRERIVAYGRSLGAGAAAALLGDRPVAAAVLQAPFTSLGAFASRYLAPAFLVRDRFDVLEAVRAFRGPVLVEHGHLDDVVPYAHGQAVATAARDGTLVTHHCAHNDCPPDWEAHVEAVIRFLREKGVVR